MTSQTNYATRGPAGGNVMGNVPMMLDGNGVPQAVSSAVPFPTSTPLVAAPVTGQAVIAVTGTAVQLASAAVPNGVVIKAKPGNAATVFVGAAGVTRTYDGTGNGYPLVAGEAISFAVGNISAIWVNGTAGDIVAYAGT